jgi:fructose-1-phosphate kinase PfkB-like protein
MIVTFTANPSIDRTCELDAPAGFLAPGGSGPHALAQSVALGTAAVSLPGNRMASPADLDLSAVQIKMEVSA